MVPDRWPHWAADAGFGKNSRPLNGSRVSRGQHRCLGFFENRGAGLLDDAGHRQSGKCCDRLMNMKRMRGRNHRPGGGGGGGSPIRHHNGQIPLNRNHVFDSNGPDLRVRGTAQQLFEKYLQLGRDATSSGDRVMAEGYFQHAEHYFRIINAIAQASQQGQSAQQGQGAPQAPQVNNQQRGRSMDEQDAEDRGGEDPLISGNAAAAQPYAPPVQNHQAPSQPPVQPTPASQPVVYQPGASQPVASQPGAAESRAPDEVRTESESPVAEARPASVPRLPRERAPRPPRERRVAEPEAAQPEVPRSETELSGA